LQKTQEIYITFQLSRGCAMGRNWLRPLC